MKTGHLFGVIVGAGTVGRQPMALLDVHEVFATKHTVLSKEEAT
jgi:hypothetical protein